MTIPLASTEFACHGFLPDSDPLGKFGASSPFAALDTLGRDLPSLLHDPGFRARARALRIPALPDGELTLPELRLYYVRLGFLASAYVNQVGEDPATVLPCNIAIPLCEVCRRLNRPPILSYDGYALYNWKRFDTSGPIALGNIDTIQDFVHLYDEHWFILVHVEIEARAASLLRSIGTIGQAVREKNTTAIDPAIAAIVKTLWSQVDVLRRIPEKMDPALYYRTFRPYIRFFEGVVYEGVDTAPMNYRGETGAQSSIMPTMVAFLKIPHRPSLLTDHLADMRRFMPAEHRALIEQVEAMPAIRDHVDKTLFNEALEAIAAFRETHLDFAKRYIAQWVGDPRGTGGTPYLQWLSQLIDETRAHKIA
jgi:indoleamine 2,3-dioxygenase